VGKLTAGVTDPLPESTTMQAKGIALPGARQFFPRWTPRRHRQHERPGLPLEVPGAEVMTRLNAKSPDEALGAPDAAISNRQKPCPPRSRSPSAAAQRRMSGKATPDEVKTLSRQVSGATSSAERATAATVNTSAALSAQPSGEHSPPTCPRHQHARPLRAECNQ
jgi:hypothetical protein